MITLTRNLYFYLVLALITASLSLVGCSSSGSSPESHTVESENTAEVVEIAFWHSFSGSLEEALLEQVSAFHATQSTVRVLPTHKGNYSETLQAGLDAIENGTAPSLLQVFEAGTATMAKRTSDYVSIDALMQQTSTQSERDYLPLITSYFTGTDGELLSLPYNVSTPVLFLNNDALNQAGVEASVSTRTWNDVEALLQTLKDQNYACPFTTSSPAWIHMDNYSARHNLPFATSGNGFDDGAVSLVFNGAQQVSHVDRLRNWSEQGLFVYMGRSNSGNGPFRDGTCTLLTGSSASRASTEAEAEFSFTVRPLPYDDINDAPLNTIIGGASLWALSGQSQSKYTAVAQFINYLSTPAVQSAWHQRTGYLPITQAAYELAREQGYYDRVPSAEIPVLQMTQDMPSTNTRGIRLDNFVQIRLVIEDELALSWNGSNKSAEQALDDAVSRSNIFLNNE